MITTHTHITKELQEQIKQEAKLIDIVSDFVRMKEKGKHWIGNCPKNGCKNTFYVYKDGGYKCHKCEFKGGYPTQFLMEQENMTYPEALTYIAGYYKIPIHQQAEKSKKNKKKGYFRDQQLRDSGISDEYQKWFLSKKNKEGTEDRYELDRYQKGSLDQFGKVIAGDDMILNYVDLDYKPTMFQRKNGKKQQYIRIRYSNPFAHTNTNGKPVRYRSPAGSGCHLWLPNWIIEAYQEERAIETLSIIEGEKKADCACLNGIPTVGISGIHNFDISGDMPILLQNIIERCKVKNVVMLLDSDWQDISTNPDKSVHLRPQSFFLAVRKFRDYFYAYNLNGIPLNIYFGYGKSSAFKGIDDLIVRNLKGKENELVEDFNKTLISRDGEGEHLDIHKITTMSEYQLKEFWKLNSRIPFFEFHEEQLKEFIEFKFKKEPWRWNEENEEFELAQKFHEHEQFFTRQKTGETDYGHPIYKYNFNYTNSLEFLKNRGFYQIQYDRDNYVFVRIEGKIIRETTAREIKSYVTDFARESIDERGVLELLLRGGKTYLGADKLTELYKFNPQLNESDKDTQYLYFKNFYWKITAEGITQKPLNQLPGFIWEEDIIDFAPKLLSEPMLQVSRSENDWKLKVSKEMEKSDIAQFYARTSMFHWKKIQALVEEDNGDKVFAPRNHPDPVTKEDLKIWKANLVCKMLAAGHLIHDNLDQGNMKAIIAMDGMESEVGKSEGGTGKGVWGSQFDHLMKVWWINGKRRDLEENKFIYAGVDERTRLIRYEDVRVNFDFETLFPAITKGIWAVKKGQDGRMVEPKKMYIETNHGMRGEGNSFLRRQYLISFADYYNADRTVADDFGRQFYSEWDEEQWNLFYNWIALCIQYYLKFRLKYHIPKQALQRRNLRQKIGEDFVRFAKDFFYDPDYQSEGIFLNNRIDKLFLMEKYLKEFPRQKNFMNARKIKIKCEQYAEYAGLTYNHTAGPDKRLKSGSNDYILLANTNYNPIEDRVIKGEIDLQRFETTFSDEQ